MVTLAEFSHAASVASILVCTLLMLIFILRFVGQDLLQGGVSRAATPSVSAPEVKMASVNLPVTLALSKDEEVRDKVKLQLTISSCQPVKLRAYWGVAVTTFHHVLRSPWEWLKRAFLHGNLFGQESCLHLSPSMQYSDQDSVLVELTRPELDLGPAPRALYPLVVVIYSVDEEVMCLSVIHVKDDVCTYPSHVLATYLKQSHGTTTHLVPIYASEDTCVVCTVNPATRVTLPCKHASVCGRCFSRLTNNRCPLCRTFIQSYFLIKDESCMEQEAAAAAEPEEETNLPLRERLAQMEHRFAIAIGLQENN